PAPADGRAVRRGDGIAWTGIGARGHLRRRLLRREPADAGDWRANGARRGARRHPATRPRSRIAARRHRRRARRGRSGGRLANGVDPAVRDLRRRSRDVRRRTRAARGHGTACVLFARSARHAHRSGGRAARRISARDDHVLLTKPTKITKNTKSRLPKIRWRTCSSRAGQATEGTEGTDLKTEKRRKRSSAKGLYVAVATVRRAARSAAVGHGRPDGPASTDRAA